MNIKNRYAAFLFAAMIAGAASSAVAAPPANAGKPDFTPGPPEHAGAPDHAGSPQENPGRGNPPAGDCQPGSGSVAAAPSRVRIAHCGCNQDGTDLVWKEIQVSTNAVGHLRHVPYSEENPRQAGCSAVNSEGPVEILHARAVSDCVMPNETENIGSVGGLEACGEDIFMMLGQSCSTDGQQEVPESS